MKNELTELLAPAGNAACLHAAISAGADAVYVGLESFNARRGADNFTLETLEEACDYAHLRGVFVYLTLNTAILPAEVNEVIETARQAYRRGIDGFIVQDIGIADELRRVLPQVRIHASTQMNTHTQAGIEALGELGVARVILARELSLAEIAALARAADEHDMEVEAFVHGALCVCYSGQCFMSSMIGGRSANRGLCAQACRLPYSLHNVALRKTLASEGEHLLSPKDLCAVDLIPELLECGVKSFKIEGRMKSPEYVFTVVSVYRKALDAALAQRAGITEVGAITEDDRTLLSDVFSRGFTTGYLEGERGNSIMSYGRPNNRGVFVGRVSAVEQKTVTISADVPLHTGDVLEFWTSRGHFAHTIEDFKRDGSNSYRMTLAKFASKGDRVFRVRNAEIGFSDDVFSPRVAVRGAISLIEGKPARLSFTAQAGRFGEEVSVEVEGLPVEAARTKSIEAAEVQEHIGRFGNTPFTLEELRLEVGEQVGVGFSQLHKLRAQALDELQESLLAPYRSRLLRRTEVRATLKPHQRKGCMVAAWATNPACARAAKRAGAEQIYVPALYYQRGAAAVAGQVSATVESAGYPKQSVLALPVVAHDLVEGTREFSHGSDLEAFMKPDKPLFVENLGQLHAAIQHGSLVEAGPRLALLNALSLQVIAQKGALRAWLSPELTIDQIAEMGKDAPLALGLTLIGRQELMVTEHCLLMSQGPCDENCGACQRRKSPHYLKDRKGYEFPVMTDSLGRSHLYNAVEFDAAHTVPELIRAGISAFMVDTTLMTVEETTKAVQRAVRARDIGLKTGDRVSKAADKTTGHLFRGIS
ncbi:MAG: U32 family peptidase [Eggerthellaceae bacterium]|nr:U32 family peptidase [Eggerthellaceae bacterium]